MYIHGRKDPQPPPPPRCRAQYKPILVASPQVAIPSTAVLQRPYEGGMDFQSVELRLSLLADLFTANPAFAAVLAVTATRSTSLIVLHSFS